MLTNLFRLTLAFGLAVCAPQSPMNLALGQQPPTDSLEFEVTLDSVSRRFAAADSSETPDFQKHVVPLLGKLG